MADKLLIALRNKYRTPAAAMRALGLDAALLKDTKAMNYRTRTARDDGIPGHNSKIMPLPGGPDSNLSIDDINDLDNGNGTLDPETGAAFVKLMCNRWAESDPDAHAEFIERLADILDQETAAPASMDAAPRMRRARDEMAPPGRMPANGIAKFPPTNKTAYGYNAPGPATVPVAAKDRALQHRAGGTFESRWGEATKQITFGGSGR